MNRNIYDYVPGKPYSAGQVINASSSRHMQAIAQATGSAEPELTLGFWQLANGEVDGATCADCEQPIHGSL